MKTSILVSLVVSFCALFMSGYVLSQQNAKPEKGSVQYEYVDSLAKISVQNAVNPLFDNVDDVLSFRAKSVEGALIEDEFNNLPEETLKTVAGVIIKREGHASRRSIVYEYRANRSVYDNLPSTAAQQTGDTTGASAGGMPYSQDTTSIKNPPTEVRYSQHDTVIGGKTYKAKKKEETSYE